MTSPTLVGDGWAAGPSSTLIANVDVYGAKLESSHREKHDLSGPSVISKNQGILSVSAGLVGVLSYICTLLMANTLTSAHYSDFAAAQMLLGIAGTIAAALVPLPLSHAVATNPAGSEGRRQGLAFAVLVSILIGSVAALFTGFITAAFAPTPMAVAVSLSAMLFFLVAAPHGWLQGELRFKWYAWSTLSEIAIRLVFTVLVVAMAWGPTGGVLGFALGSLVLLVVPLAFYRDLRFEPRTLTQRWRWSETGDIALVLCIVSALIGFDVVIIAFLDGGSEAAAGFQALATIAKGPVYIAAGTALVAFPLLRTPDVDASKTVAHALRSFAWLALPAAAVISSIPHNLMGLVLPQQYHSSLQLLPWLAGAGFGFASMSVLITILLAMRCYRRCQVGLVTTGFSICGGIFIGWHLNAVTGLAIGSAVGSILAAAALAAIARPQLPRGIARESLKALIMAALLTGVLTAAALLPALWLLLTAATGVFALTLQRRETSFALPVRGNGNVWRRWQCIQASPAVVTIVSVAVAVIAAFGVRAIGLNSAFELWVDEILYAELGRSVSLGQMPNLPDGPFFLHPPGFFLAEGVVIKALGLSGPSFDLVYDLRWLNASVGALTVGLGFLLVRKVANTTVAWFTAAVLSFEPFILRNNSRVFLETFGTAWILAGYLLLVTYMVHRPKGSNLLPMFFAGLLLGYGVLTKDIFALISTAPIIMAVLWRRTLPLRQAVVVLFGSATPYAVYLTVLSIQELLPLWLWAKTNGVRRMLGFEQITGFNAEGSPSLVGRMIEQAGTFGTSYILLGFGPLAALFVCFSARACRRMIGLAGLLMGSFGLYSAAFGTFEEQYGYPVMVTGILSISIFAMEISERWPILTKTTLRVSIIFTLLVVALGFRAETTMDNGYARIRNWMINHLPSDALVSVTNSTGEFAFADDPRIGAWPSPQLMVQNDVEYILTQSAPTMQGYGYVRPDMLKWLSYEGTELVSFSGPTNGTTTLWHVKEEQLLEALDAGIGLPSKTYETER